MITILEILYKLLKPRKSLSSAAEQNNYRREKQIHFDDLLK